MDSDVEDEFSAAAEFVRRSKIKVSNDQKLQFYALFKQATEGRCTAPKPSVFDMIGRSKWNAWHNLGDLDRTTASKSYIDLVTKLSPTWRDEQLPERSDDASSGGSSTFGAPSVSTMAVEEEAVKSDEEKTLADWCVEGSLDRVRQKLMEDQSSVSLADAEGLTSLHWACDRGHVELCNLLIQNNAPLNAQDEAGQTPLHYAVSCDHIAVIRSLVEAGADVMVCDSDGKTPQDLAESDDAKQALILSQESS